MYEIVVNPYRLFEPTKGDEAMKRNPMFLVVLAMLTIFSFISGCGGGSDNSTPNTGGSIVIPPDAPKLPGSIPNVEAVAGNGQVTLTFNPPTDDGGSPILGYVIYVSPGDGVPINCTNNQHVVAGLTNGVMYKFSVGAINSIGTSQNMTDSNSALPMDPTAKWFPGFNPQVRASDGNGNSYFSGKRNGKTFFAKMTQDGTESWEKEVPSLEGYSVHHIIASKDVDRVILFATNLSKETVMVLMRKDGTFDRLQEFYFSTRFIGVSFIQGEQKFQTLCKTDYGHDNFRMYDLDGNILAGYQPNTEWEYELMSIDASAQLVLSVGVQHHVYNDDVLTLFVLKRDLTFPQVSYQREAATILPAPTDIPVEMTMNRKTGTLFATAYLQQEDRSRKQKLFEIELVNGDWSLPINIPDPDSDGEFKFLSASDSGDIYGVYMTPSGTNQLIRYSGGIFTKVADLKRGVSTISLEGNLAFIMYHDPNNSFPAVRMEVYDISTSRAVTASKALRRSTSNWKAPGNNQ